MNKPACAGVLLAAAMLFMSGAYAQSTNTNDSTSGANVNSTQQTSSSNEGVNAVVNSYGADRTHATVNEQVPLSLVGYGSFSQNNCSNALGVGATTKIFSLVFNAPKPEVNCQHMVRSDAFGREAGLANATKKPAQAEIQRALSVWEACTADLETTAACIRMNAIRYVDPQHPDLTKTMPYPHFVDEGVTMPAWNQPAGEAVSSLPASDAPVAAPIPSHPKGWTNEQWLKDHPAATSQVKPANDQQFADSQAALNSLPWVQKASR